MGWWWRHSRGTRDLKSAVASIWYLILMVRAACQFDYRTIFNDVISFSVYILQSACSSEQFPNSISTRYRLHIFHQHVDGTPASADYSSFFLSHSVISSNVVSPM